MVYVSYGSKHLIRKLSPFDIRIRVAGSMSNFGLRRIAIEWFNINSNRNIN